MKLKQLKQTTKSKKFIKAVESLIDNGEVKNKLEIVTKLKWDDTAMSNVLAGRRNVPPKVYRDFTNIYKIDIEDEDSINLESIIRIEAKCDVVLSCLAELLAAQKGGTVAKIISDQETLVREQIKASINKLK